MCNAALCLPSAMHYPTYKIIYIMLGNDEVHVRQF